MGKQVFEELVALAAKEEEAEKQHQEEMEARAEAKRITQKLKPLVAIGQPIEQVKY